jgi:hypothetical protein
MTDLAAPWSSMQFTHTGTPAAGSAGDGNLAAGIAVKNTAGIFYPVSIFYLLFFRWICCLVEIY